VKKTLGKIQRSNREREGWRTLEVEREFKRQDTETKGRGREKIKLIDKNVKKIINEKRGEREREREDTLLL
jgi:hypothetical protein